MSSERDNKLFELEQRLAQVGRRLSTEDASSLIAEDFFEFGALGCLVLLAKLRQDETQCLRNDGQRCTIREEDS
jgi:hypothetical protein